MIKKNCKKKSNFFKNIKQSNSNINQDLKI